MVASSKPKLNILCLTSDTYPPFRVDVDVLFGDELTRLGHQVDWIMQSADDANRFRIEQWKSGQVFVGKSNLGERLVDRLVKHFHGIANDLRVFGLARNPRYDLVQVKDKFVGALFALVAAKLARKKFVYWLSYPFPEASLYEADVNTARYPILYRIRGHIFSAILYGIIAKHADHIFVQSEQMKRDMVAKGVRESLLSAVPMGVSLAAEGAEKPEVTEATEATEEVPVKRAQMIYLGTLLQTRRLDFLVRVLAAVKEVIPTATLLMVGPEELPGDMDLLQTEANRLGVADALTITGRLPREEAFELVKQSAVCFSPFYPTPILNSTSPTKLIEYFSLKKAAVANDHPEQREVIADSGGGYCVAYREQDFAKAAIQIIENPQSAREMGQAGYRYVAQHRSYEILASGLEGKYMDIIVSESSVGPGPTQR